MADPGYDALLVVSFGGPEGLSDVIPFLENVLAGRNVPRARLLEVAKHYELFGGISPINEQNRNLIARLQKELDANGPGLPIYWGNRNWHPLLPDTVRQMGDDGIKHALAFVTSAYSSYSSCRQYLEDIEKARATVGPGAPAIDKLRAFYNHPGFIDANVENVRLALQRIPAGRRAAAEIVFTAHSIPLAMTRQCEYEAQLQEVSRLVAERVGAGAGRGRLVFQSRSGPPTQPWLEPEIGDYLKELSANHVSDVVIAPIGFVSDHMEVLYDLDTEACALGADLGLNVVRAATVGTHPTFIRMIRELIIERLDPEAPRRCVGTREVAQDICAPGCCLPGADKISGGKPPS